MITDQEPRRIEAPISVTGRRVFRHSLMVLGFAASVLLLPGYLPPLNPILKYQIDRTSIPEAFFDYVVRPAPRVIMELKANGKLTHDPDWVPAWINSPQDCLPMEADPGLLHRENFFQGKWFEVDKYNWSKVQISLGAWWRVFQIKPEDSQVRNWVLKFTGLGNQLGQQLRIRVPREAKVLQGDQPYLACGEDGNGNQLRLKKSGPVPRWESVEGITV